MGFLAQVKTEQPTPTSNIQGGVFSRLLSSLDDPTGNALLGSPLAAGTTMVRGALPLVKWATDRLVGGGSMLSGPVSKITQVPIKDIIVRSADHPDEINPLKVNQIQSLLSSAPNRVPAVELLQQGGKYILKDGRHRFTAAQGLGLDTVPAIIGK